MPSTPSILASTESVSSVDSPSPAETTAERLDRIRRLRVQWSDHELAKSIQQQYDAEYAESLKYKRTSSGVISTLTSTDRTLLFGKARLFQIQKDTELARDTAGDSTRPPPYTAQSDDTQKESTSTGLVLPARGKVVKVPSKTGMSPMLNISF